MKTIDLKEDRIFIEKGREPHPVLIKTIDIKEAQSNFDDLMNKVTKDHPIVIDKCGEHHATLMLFEKFDELVKREKVYFSHLDFISRVLTFHPYKLPQISETCIKTINARDAQDNFRNLINEVITEPIIINEQGKFHVALIAFQELRRLLSLDDFYFWQRVLIEGILPYRKTNIPLCADYRGLPYYG